MAKKIGTKTKSRGKVITTKESFSKRLQEGYPQVGIDSSEDYGWRSLTSAANRDLNPLTQKRMQEIAHYLYDSNPLAHRILEITKDFVVGDGFQFLAKDQKIQDLLNDFWNDPDNNWEVKQDTKVLELGLWGEQCYPVFVNKHNGHVKLGYLDPGLITKVRLDKNNPERVKEVIWQKRNKAMKLQVINSDLKKNSGTSGKLVGECFYFAINKVVWASRGRSDLLCLHPDTIINTLEGNIPIKKLVGKKVLVYSWDQKTNSLVIGEAKNIRKTRKNAKLVKVHFTNGDSIITTPDHLLLLRDAKAYRQAKDFLPSDRVQAVGKTIKDGYVWIQYKKHKWMLEHRFLMGKMLGRKLSSNEIVHHKNRDTLDNRLSNLELLSRADHTAIHIKDNLLTIENMKKTKKILQKKMEGNSLAKGNRFNLTKEQILKESKGLKLAYANMNALQKENIRKRNTKASLSRFQKGKRINQYATFNHEIVYVENLDYRSDVYDLEVEKYHNFSANGIISHNCISDWIDGYDQFLFARLERAFYLNNFIWDVLCEGMDKNQITEFAKDIQPPKPGSLRIHNEKITWNAITPKLEAADASAEAGLFKGQILGGAGFPEHWFGIGEKTTRATANEMQAPTLTKLKSRQKYIKNMIIHIFNFVIDQAIIAGYLDEKVDRTFIVKPSAIVTKDARGLAITAEKFASAMQIAKQNKWITDASAKAAFHIFISQLGIELRELEKVQKKEDEIKPGGNEDDEPKEE